MQLTWLNSFLGHFSTSYKKLQTGNSELLLKLFKERNVLLLMLDCNSMRLDDCKRKLLTERRELLLRLDDCSRQLLTERREKDSKHLRESGCRLRPPLHEKTDCLHNLTYSWRNLAVI